MEIKNDVRDIVIISNSPGEISSWVKVTIEKLKNRDEKLRIIVMLVPCPYASGREEEVTKKIEGVDIVISPSKFIQYILGFDINIYQPSPYGVVVFLGGDFWHALYISKKLNYPSVVYSVRPSRWNKFFDYIAVRDEIIKSSLESQGIPKERIMQVGSLMIEQVKPVYVLDEARKKWNLDPKNKVVGIFAGSRFYHVKVSLPFYLKVADEIRSQMPDTDFLLGVSPFLTIENIRECIKTYSYSVEGTSGELIAEDNGNLIIKTKNQTEIKILKGYQYDMINLSDIVLTIPGTNTAEIGVMGKPMVVGITWKAKIPRGGLTGFLSSILFIDSLKKYIFQMYIRRIKYTSLPNQMAQKEVVPEIIVEKKSDIISDKVVELLRDDKKRSEISDELKRVFKSTNASEKMVDLILKSFAVKPFDWLNRSIFSIKLREFMFKWRGYLFIPFAMFVLFTAKPTIFSLIAGSAVAVLGELLRIWGVGYAGSTTRRDKVIAPEIVTGGPFAHLKNPLYLGNFITAFGFCIMALGKSTASDSVFLFMLCIIYYAAIYNLIIPLEEAYLYRTFGDLYLRYSKLVPKIIPQIKPYNERNGRFEWREIINTEIHTIILFFAVFAVMIYKYIKL